MTRELKVKPGHGGFRMRREPKPTPIDLSPPSFPGLTPADNAEVLRCLAFLAMAYDSSKLRALTVIEPGETPAYYLVTRDPAIIEACKAALA